MAKAPRRLCPRAICNGLYDPNTGTCDRCGPIAAKPRHGWDRKQKQAGKMPYDNRAWKARRRAKLARDPLCAACRRAGRHVAATDVHHLAGFVDAADPQFLAWSNLESICRSCHAKESAKERWTFPTGGHWNVDARKSSS